jgi:hypothetical protein
MKKILIVLLMLLVSSIAFYSGRVYEHQNNIEVIEANNFKRECLNNYDKMSGILEEYIDRHIDDSTCSNLVDSLINLGYYKYYHKVDSLYSTQL